MRDFLLIRPAPDTPCAREHGLDVGACNLAAPDLTDPERVVDREHVLMRRPKSALAEDAPLHEGGRIPDDGLGDGGELDLLCHHRLQHLIALPCVRNRAWSFGAGTDEAEDACRTLLLFRAARGIDRPLA